MTKVLFIKGNPKTSMDSKCLALGERFLETYKVLKPEDEIVEIDLYKEEIVEIDKELLHVIENLKKGISNDNLSEELQKKVDKYNNITDQFVNADKYIFATPLWNLALPDKVKTYIDAVCVAGKSFKYTPKGPTGLLEDKKCVHLHASGGFHSEDPVNYADGYLKDIMNFMGVKEYKSIIIEGYNAVPQQAEEIIENAYSKISETVDWLV